MLTESSITFPNLQDVRGAFHVISTAAMSCDPFDGLYSEDVIKGNYQCRTLNDQGNTTRSAASTTSSAAATATGGSTNTTETPRSGLSAGKKVAIGVGVGVGVGGGGILLALGIAFYLWRRRRNRPEPSKLPPEVDGTEVDRAAMLGNGAEKYELEQPREEMAAGKLAQELPAAHGETELDRRASTKLPPGIESRHEMAANETPSPTEEVMDAQSDERRSVT